MSFSLEDIHVTGNGDVESAKGPKCRQIQKVLQSFFFSLAALSLIHVQKKMGGMLGWGAVLPRHIWACVYAHVF
jgi:hypothetical protein